MAPQNKPNPQGTRREALPEKSGTKADSRDARRAKRHAKRHGKAAS